MKEKGDEIVDDRENEDKKDEEDNIQGVSVKVQMRMYGELATRYSNDHDKSIRSQNET